MTMRNSVAILLTGSLAFLAFGCSVMQQTNADTREADLAALLETDKAWAEADANSDTKNMIENFYSYVLSDAIVLAPHVPIAEGDDASAFFEQMYALPGFSLHWQATSSEVSGLGDLGYTIGTYELSMDGPDGSPVIDKGKYMTVWKKQTDDTWKVAVDMFNTNLPQ